MLQSIIINTWLFSYMYAYTWAHSKNSGDSTPNSCDTIGCESHWLNLVCYALSHGVTVFWCAQHTNMVCTVHTNCSYSSHTVLCVFIVVHSRCMHSSSVLHIVSVLFLTYSKSFAYLFWHSKFSLIFLQKQYSILLLPSYPVLYLRQ